MKTVKAVVKAKISTKFPMDMLRYDRCCPYSESDSSFLESLVLSGCQTIYAFNYGNKQPKHFRFWQVVICKNVESNVKKPFAEERWNSFGCEIKIIEDFESTPKSKYISVHEIKEIDVKNLSINGLVVSLLK